MLRLHWPHLWLVAPRPNLPFPPFQDIHVLINCAAIADPHMPLKAEAALAHWRTVIDVNLTGKFGVAVSP